MEWIRGEEIGHGGFASINLAKPNKKKLSNLPPLMAVKSCKFADSATLRNEAEVLRLLGECDQIIRCYGAERSVDGGSERYNLLLEYAPGGSLVNEMRRRGGRLPEPEVRRHARSVLAALRHIHSRGFVHGDVKVQNILVFPSVNAGGSTEVKVADFGLAKEAGPTKGGSFQWRGTPLYMSPESVNDNEYEAPADVWALGCAVAEMATGRPAWDHPADGDVFGLMMRIGTGDETPAIPEGLSDEGKDFLGKCFEKDPKKRWTAEMLLNHPFVVPEKENFESGPILKSRSPRSHFDIEDWESSVQSSKVSIFPSPMTSTWEFWEEQSEFGSSGDPDDHIRDSAIERITSLDCGEMPNWEDSESGWVNLR